MNDRVEPQPEAVHNDSAPLWPMVIEDVKHEFTQDEDVSLGVAHLLVTDMVERDAMGTKKHGTQLQAHNGRDPLIDAYQECLDMCVYLKQAAVETTANGGLRETYYDIQDAYWIAIGQAMDIRRSLQRRDQEEL